MSEWIKVTEKLPEYDTRVLLYFGNYSDGHVEDGFIGDEDSSGDWYHYLYDGDSLNTNPTHWMPFPPPPAD